MSVWLFTITVDEIAWLPNSIDAVSMAKFINIWRIMVRHKVMLIIVWTNMAFAKFLDPDVTFSLVKRKKGLIHF